MKDIDDFCDLIWCNASVEITLSLVEQLIHMHSKLYNTDISQIILQNLESGRIDENKMTFRDVWYFHLETFMFWEYFDSIKNLEYKQKMN